MAETTEKRTPPNTAADISDDKYKIEIATQTLERNIAFITNCDSKTSIVLTAIGVLLTIILTNDGLNKIFSIINSCIREKNFCNVVYLICFVIAVLIMSFGLYNLASVLIAKTKNNIKGLDSSNSLIFFSGIVKSKDYNVYKERFYAMNRKELLDDLIAEIYINADIATQRYKRYNTGLKLTIIGFILFAVVLLIGVYLY